MTIGLVAPLALTLEAVSPILGLWRSDGAGVESDRFSFLPVGRSGLAGDNCRYSVKTYSPKKSEIERQWYVVDADGLTLGRMATEVARILRGKHKPTFAPHIDTGDHVIIVNADKIVLSANKAEDKKLHSHSGYPGGLTTRSYGEAMARKPADTVRKSVTGMLPKNRLGRQMASKLKVYAGPDHPHTAQAPQVLEIPGARREVK